MHWSLVGLIENLVHHGAGFEQHAGLWSGHARIKGSQGSGSEVVRGEWRVVSEFAAG
jgi:hypothetical protein